MRLWEWPAEYSGVWRSELGSSKRSQDSNTSNNVLNRNGELETVGGQKGIYKGHPETPDYNISKHLASSHTKKSYFYVRYQQGEALLNYFFYVLRAHTCCWKESN